MLTETLAATGEPKRFRIEKQLGAGAFGTVFVVWDQLREQRIALKRLERADPASIYRFKQEFRALADLTHPNLVRFHEFFSWEDSWCLTMDWIDGRRFDQWVRPWQGMDQSTSGIEVIAGAADREMSPETVRHPAEFDSITLQDASALQSKFDLARLRHALSGLFRGVFALHGAGILHRDLKPSNVLVKSDGQVVILDFGLVATNVIDVHKSADGGVSGTPAYMSPEQARGEALSAASDYYAIGVMLYEIITGEVPFAGPMPSMLGSRSQRPPPPIADKYPTVPADLADLTMALLAPDPAARPSRRAILDLLGIEDAPLSLAAKAPTGSTFVGREVELLELARHFEGTRQGRTVVVEVRGPSGFGKTTLVRQFLNQLRSQSGVVTLEGRCFERESMPFKAFDSLIDSLGTYLRRLRPVEAATFLPRDTPALLRLFPSLGRLDFIASLPGRAPSHDPHELRRRAFSALREILTRISDVQPLVLFIDDVQWGDADSATLLEHLLAPPEPPSLLLIVAARDESAQASAVLKVVQQERPEDNAWDHGSVTIGALTREQATRLASVLLERAQSDAPQASAIAEESAGNPLFVAQLVRSVVKGQSSDTSVTLQHVVAERVANLPPTSKQVLSLLACSERPVHESVLRGAAGISLSTLLDSVDRLRDEQLVTVALDNHDTYIEIPHDRLRLAVRDGMAPEATRHCHLALAVALEQRGDADPETLAHHFGAAEEHSQSATWNARAAARAAEGLAFDRAVKLYRRALSHANGDARLELLLKHAEALARAGRGAEAAPAFLEVADASPASMQAEYRKRAATQFLRAGHIEQALKTLGPVLDRAGLSLPKSPQTALASLLYQRTRLKLRGLDFRERSLSEVRPQDLERIDLCWAVGTGLSGIDLVRSAHYHTFHLLHSLESGEPTRVVRALSMHAVLKSLESSEGAKVASGIAARVHQLAERIGQPSSVGWATAASAAVAWGLSEYKQCVKCCDEAALLLREGTEDNFREVGSVQVWFALHSLFLLGEVKEFLERTPQAVSEAVARGDLYTLSTAQAYDMPLYWALRDKPAEGRREAEAALEPWPRDAWYHQHWAHLRASCLLDLYEGEGRRVVERVELARATMKRTMQLRLRTLRIEVSYLEARGNLAVASEVGVTRKHEGLVTEKIEALYREDSPLASVYALALKAGLTQLTQPEHALSQFVAAEKAFEAQSMPLHAAAAKMAYARVVGGQHGLELGNAATLSMKSRGVTDPARLCAMLMPGA